MFPIVPNVAAYRASACRCHAAASGVPGKEDLPMSAARIAFSTLAFPDASLATAISLGRSWGYAGVELRLIDRNLIDPAMTAADRMAVKTPRQLAACRSWLSTARSGSPTTSLTLSWAGS